MTRDEFDLWWDHHANNFAGLRGWLARNVPGEKAMEFYDAWASILARTELADAKAASDAMARGDEERPQSNDSHPAAIVRIARRIRADRERSRPRPHYADGEETVRCRRCGDDGVVLVWDEPAMKAVRDGTLGARGTLLSCVRRCNCEASEKWRWMKAVYDPSRQCPIGVKGISDAEEQAKLMEFVGGMRPAGYHDEFAEFGT
jgi:hypothetical protein